MASISAIRDGLATRLATISGIRPYDYAKGDITPPATGAVAVVVPNPGQFVSFDATMGRGSDNLTFLIYVIVSQAWARTAEERLDGYCDTAGATSVKTAVEADEDLAGVVHFARVSGISDYGDIDYAGVQYYGAVFTVEVTA